MPFPPITDGLCAADMAHLARCAWQRQQGTLDPARANREFATVVLWTAAASQIRHGSHPT